MEEEDDDFYGGPASAAQDFAPPSNLYDEDREQKMDVSEDQAEEEEDSDDDVQFTLEKPEGDKNESSTQSKTTKQQSSSVDRAVSAETKHGQSGTPIKQEQRSVSTLPAAVKGTFTHDGKEGKDFPEVRTSQVDVNSIPTWPANGKPITEVDIDADLAEHSKPWRLPGTDQTDFFNYGFDEYTWAQYCVRQQTMINSIADQKQADAQFKGLLGSGGGGAPGGGGGMPPGMPSMPGMSGMPSPEEMMQQMMASGLNPNDPNAFMQMMMSSGMPGGGQGPTNQQGGGGFGQQGGGFGSGQNSVSPHPQAGQGFQPPSGPAAQIQQSDQSGFPGNMEGYSAQQMAIMQQGGMGGQGGGRRGNRGRGRYY